MKIDDNNNNAKDEKKGFITEKDTATLLQRYSAPKILALLQEVAHLMKSEKINYDELVAKTTTGITNAREYQMLWRHLAYREPLPEKFDNGDEPMRNLEYYDVHGDPSILLKILNSEFSACHIDVKDILLKTLNSEFSACHTHDVDSDYEYNVEVAPPVSADASTEAAAYVKVLLASGLPSASSHLDGTMLEAPLTINIPNGQFKTYEPSASAKGVNITVPVFIQKPSLPATGTTAVAKVEGDNANRPASNVIVPRKKRKKWSEEEDLELISAVNIYGEGNWTQIVKAKFKGDRTANQLSQRWGIVKKRQRKSVPGGDKGTQSVKKEALLAAHQAITHFLDNGSNRTPITVGIGGTNVNINTAETNANNESGITNGIHSTGLQTTTAEGLNAKKTNRMGSFGPTPKGQIASKKTLPKSNVDLDPLRATVTGVNSSPAAEVLPKPVQSGEDLSGSEQVQEGKVESPKQKSVSDTNTQNPAASLDTKKVESNDKATTYDE